MGVAQGHRERAPPLEGVRGHDEGLLVLVGLVGVGVGGREGGKARGGGRGRRKGWGGWGGPGAVVKRAGVGGPFGTEERPAAHWFLFLCVCGCVCVGVLWECGGWVGGLVVCGLVFAHP